MCDYFCYSTHTLMCARAHIHTRANQKSIYELGTCSQGFSAKGVLISCPQLLLSFLVLFSRRNSTALQIAFPWEARPVYIQVDILQIQFFLRNSPQCFVWYTYRVHLHHVESSRKLKMIAQNSLCYLKPFILLELFHTPSLGPLNTSSSSLTHSVLKVFL